MYSKEIAKIIDEIASRYGITRDQVTYIVTSQFGATAEALRSARRNDIYFPTVMLPYLGKFCATPGKIRKAENLRRRMSELPPRGGRRRSGAV